VELAGATPNPQRLTRQLRATTWRLPRLDWQRFWFVTACVIAMLVGHAISETAERAEKLQGENLMLKHANDNLRAEIDRLKAGGS
jgi:hypothetical protein